MEVLLSFEEVFQRLESIGKHEIARCMKLGIKMDPNYSLEFANKQLADYERKIAIEQNKPLPSIETDVFHVKSVDDLQDRINTFKELKIKNRLEEVLTKKELSAFIDYWNGMVKEANLKGLYFKEAVQSGHFGGLRDYYSFIQLGILARHRSRKLNGWKRYNEKYHLEDEEKFRAFIIDGTKDEYLEKQRRIYLEGVEQESKSRENALKEKVGDYYNQKIPLFAEQLIEQKEDEFSYKRGIREFSKITF